MISHCGFDLNCPDNCDVDHAFMCLLTICVSSGKMSIQIISSFFNWAVVIKLHEFFIYFWY